MIFGLFIAGKIYRTESGSGFRRRQVNILMITFDLNNLQKNVTLI